MSEWKILTNHGVVLMYIAMHPRILSVDIATAVGIRERTVRRIIADLAADGYLVIKRVGRNNHYEINPDAPLRHGVISPARIGDLMKAVLPNAGKLK